MKILILDSGVGGISILNFLINTNPNHQYTYYLDNLNFPYGNKTSLELKNIFEKQIKPIFNDFDYVIIACNTLSILVTENDYKFNTNLITMMDLHKLNSKKLEDPTILATPLSTKSEIWNKIYKTPKIISGENLAYLIENDDLNGIQNFILNHTNFENIVLSCTHYNFIKESISSSIDITKYILDLIDLNSNINKSSLNIIFSGASNFDLFNKFANLKTISLLDK